MENGNSQIYKMPGISKISHIHKNWRHSYPLAWSTPIYIGVVIAIFNSWNYKLLLSYKDGPWTIVVGKTALFLGWHLFKRLPIIIAITFWSCAYQSSKRLKLLSAWHFACIFNHPSFNQKSCAKTKKFHSSPLQSHGSHRSFLAPCLTSWWL